MCIIAYIRSSSELVCAFSKLCNPQCSWECQQKCQPLGNMNEMSTIANRKIVVVYYTKRVVYFFAIFIFSKEGTDNHVDLYLHLRVDTELFVHIHTSDVGHQPKHYRLFHSLTRTTSSGCLVLHRTIHALWNLYGNPYRNRAEKEEETVTWWGNS